MMSDYQAFWTIEKISHLSLACMPWIISYLISFAWIGFGQHNLDHCSYSLIFPSVKMLKMRRKICQGYKHCYLTDNPNFLCIYLWDHLPTVCYSERHYLSHSHIPPLLHSNMKRDNIRERRKKHFTFICHPLFSLLSFAILTFLFTQDITRPFVFLSFHLWIGLNDNSRCISLFEHLPYILFLVLVIFLSS